MPDWKAEIKKQLADLKLAPVREAEIIEELAQHLESLYEELLADGAAQKKLRKHCSRNLEKAHCCRRSCAGWSAMSRRSPSFLMQGGEI